MDKKREIEFGHANEKNPTGSWEGITFGDENRTMRADYIGTVESNGNTYMITKVTDAYNRDVVGTFFVVDATAKVYDDGSGIIFLDQQQSDVAQKIQEGLTSGKYSDVEAILNDEEMEFTEGNEQFQEIVEHSFQFDSPCIVTAIKHNEFYRMIGRKVEKVTKGEIEFGHANEKNPTGSWEGITFGDENRTMRADYIGTVESNGNTYMITKVTDAYNRDVVGTFFVVDATAKVYDDGSGIIFLDQQQSDVAQKIQEGLTSGKYSDVEAILNDEEMEFTEGNEQFQEIVEHSFQFDSPCIVTAIKHNEFYRMIGKEASDSKQDILPIAENIEQSILGLAANGIKASDIINTQNEITRGINERENPNSISLED